MASRLLARPVESNRPKVVRRRPYEPLSLAELEAIARDGSARDMSEPRATRARYDTETDLVVVELRSGSIVGVPRLRIRPLRHATFAAIKGIRVTGNGANLEWPDLDEGLEFAHFLELALSMPTSQSSGRRGGKSRSKAKAAAARRNGAKGGRPKKRSS